MNQFMKYFLRKNTFLVTDEGTVCRYLYYDSNRVSLETSECIELSLPRQKILRKANGREKINWYYNYVLSKLTN